MLIHFKTSIFTCMDNDDLSLKYFVHHFSRRKKKLFCLSLFVALQVKQSIEISFTFRYETIFARLRSLCLTANEEFGLKYWFIIYASHRRSLQSKSNTANRSFGKAI